MIRRVLTAQRFLPSLFAVLTASVAACGPGAKPLHTTDSGVEPSPADGSNADSLVAFKSIGAEGGAVVGPGGAEVVIPPGALAETSMIGVSDFAYGTNAGESPSVPAQIRGVGHAMALTPHGLTFAEAATIRIPFDPALATRASGKPLKLYTATPRGTWSEVAGARVDGTTMIASVMHFSFFIVGFEAPEQTLPAGKVSKLDMLFMIDNSKSMQPLQQKLLQSFPMLIQTLKALPGGLPDLHIGVVSSSLGAGPNGSDAIPNCPYAGDAGRLQWLPRGTCVAGGPTDHFIAAGPGEATKNYPGSIEDAFTCIAALGDEGCGFEHSLESIAIALGVRGIAPPENANFMRPDAALALVLITNEDDCSAPVDTKLFDPTSRYVSDPLGPLASYRCNEYGHRCAGQAPPRTLASGQTVTLTDCHSAEDGVLYNVADYAKAFKGLRADPSRVFLSVIAGAPTPYAVEPTPPTLIDDPARWPSVVHSCTSASGEYGDPAVRLAELVAAFGDNGSFSSICGELAPALTGLGAALGKATGPSCLQGEVVAAGAAPTLAAGCAVFESVAAAGGTRAETQLPACGVNGAAGPCWSLKANAACAGSAAELAITRVDEPPAGAVLVVRCTP